MRYLLIFCGLTIGLQTFAQMPTRRYTRSEQLAARLVERVLTKTPVIDGHNDLFIHYMDCRECPRGLDDYRIDTINRGHTDIPRLRAGSAGALLFNVFGNDNTASSYESAWNLFRAMELRYQNDFKIVETSKEMRRAIKDGKVALLPILEGAVRLQNDTALLRKYYGWGLRSVTFAYRTNGLADGSDDTVRHRGISVVGRDMVKKMNELGVLIDMSHISANAMSQILDISRAPVIFSHSNARALCDVNRNVPDSILFRLKENKGLIMLTFVPYFTKAEHSKWLDAGDLFYFDLQKKHSNDKAVVDSLMGQWELANPEPRVNVADMADHFDYVKNLIGVDHIGLAGDFDGISFTIQGLSDVSMYTNLFLELARRGWSESDLRKIAAENFLRVFEKVERVARKG